MRTTLKHLAPVWGATLTSPAWAAAGHGMPGNSHWHASDGAGFLAALVALALVVWLAGRK